MTFCSLGSLSSPTTGMLSTMITLSMLSVSLGLFCRRSASSSEKIENYTVTQGEWLSRDNLSSPPFALVTYRHVKN